MKKIFTLAFLAISISCFPQNGYVNVGTSALFAKKEMSNSITMGVGYKYENLSAGILADFFTDNNQLIPALDLRGYLFKKNKSPYISLQPGYILYTKQDHDIKVSGSFAGAAMAGFEFKPKEVGFNISAGYQYTSYKILGITSKGHSLKINLSVVL